MCLTGNPSAWTRRLIELDISHSPQTSAELASRRKLQDITKLCADPVIQLNPRHICFPRWERF